MSARGDHAAAAREYEALSAQARGTALNPVLMSAAKEWLRANDAGAAEAAIARLVMPLESDQPSIRSLLLAEAALLRGEASRGWELLSG
ncbi:MAG: hypothetical protein ACK55I_31315, partial [bacterium]